MLTVHRDLVRGLTIHPTKSYQSQFGAHEVAVPIRAEPREGKSCVLRI